MNFGWVLLIIIISVVVNIAKKAAKQANHQQNQNQAAGQRQDMQQVLRQKAAEYRQKAEEYQRVFSGSESAGDSARNAAGTETPSYRIQADQGQGSVYMEGADLNRYSSEGIALGRNTLEGASLEGMSLENAPSPDRITPTEAGVYEARRTGSRVMRAGNGFINQRSVLNGVIMSEVLSSRGGRRRAR